MILEFDRSVRADIGNDRLTKKIARSNAFKKKLYVLRNLSLTDNECLFSIVK